jgi:hypothetical protein
MTSGADRRLARELRLLARDLRLRITEAVG